MAWPAAALGVLLLLCVSSTLVASQSDDGKRYRSYDGSNNNKDHPNWGRAGTPYARLQVPQTAYGGGVKGSDGLAGANRPSPRAITLRLLNQPYFKGKSATNTSYLLTGLGQLVSHDTTRGVATNKSNGGAAPIPIPPNDPFFAAFKNQSPVQGKGRKALPYTRTNYTRLVPNGPREQVNDATTWLDASVLYGQSPATVKMLRAGVAGRLLTDENKLLPFNVDPESGKVKNSNMKNLAERVPLSQLRLSGNANVNQSPLIMSMVTLLMREHNRRARIIEAANPLMGDEEIFQEARKWVIGHFQRLALDDYLTALGIVLPPYKGYNASLNPAIDAFFTTVAYRYGHATITDTILRLDENWNEHPKGHLPLEFTYYNPNVAFEAGLEPVLRGLLASAQGRIEPRWSLAVAGSYAGTPHTNGTDLPAINIQRGRDHGIPDYNTCRRALGLAPVKTFADITPDTEVQAALQELYGNVNNIDAYVGGMAEPPHGSSHVGELFTKSIVEQFTRLRDADFFYYENGAMNKLYNASEIDEIRKTSLRDILEHNTAIKDLPTNIWAAGSMTCANDASHGGGGGQRRELMMNNIMGNTATLQVKPADTDGWARVLVSSSTTSGWLGFAVADKGSSAAMIGSDMVIGRMDNGKPLVARYHATDHSPPKEVTEGSDRLKLIRFEQTASNTLLEFERPMAGGSGQYDRAMSAGGPMRIIMARGRSNGFSAAEGYHGTGNREIIELPQGLYSGASSLTADNAAIAKRKAHGILMAVNFIVVFPLGALAARQLRCTWLQSPLARAVLFYVHIITQVAGVAIATAGFVIATNWFGTPYADVPYSHGKLGVAILALVYSQLLVGFARPTATASPTRRFAWDVVHTILGRAATLIGIANVGLGVVIFAQYFRGDFGVWAGVCAAGLGFISLVQYMLDRKEKHAVLQLTRQMTDHAFGDSGAKDSGTHPGDAGLIPAGGSQSLSIATSAAQGAGGNAGVSHQGGDCKLTAGVLQQHQQQAAAAAAAGGMGVGPNGGMAVGPHGGMGVAPNSGMGVGPHDGMGGGPNGGMGIAPNSGMGVGPHGGMGVAPYGGPADAYVHMRGDQNTSGP